MLPIGVMAVLRTANRNAEGAGLKQFNQILLPTLFYFRGLVYAERISGDSDYFPRRSSVLREALQ